MCWTREKGWQPALGGQPFGQGFRWLEYSTCPHFTSNTPLAMLNPTTTSPFKNSPNSVIGSTDVSEKSIECYRPVFLWKLCSRAHCRCLRRRRAFLRRPSQSVFPLAHSIHELLKLKNLHDVGDITNSTAVVDLFRYRVHNVRDSYQKREHFSCPTLNVNRRILCQILILLISPMKYN